MLAQRVRILRSLAVAFLLIFGWLYLAGFWKTAEERDQERQGESRAEEQESRALNEAEQKCREESALDMDDCVDYRMREYHRGKKLLERADAEIKQQKGQK